MPLVSVLVAVRRLTLRRPEVQFARLLETRVGCTRLASDDRGDVWAGALRPWARRRASQRIADRAAFVAFAEPGWVKVALDLAVAPHGAGTMLATETRIAARSDDARRTFGGYWRVVRLGSRLTRESLLRAVERRAMGG